MQDARPLYCFPHQPIPTSKYDNWEDQFRPPAPEKLEVIEPEQTIPTDLIENMSEDDSEDAEQGEQESDEGEGKQEVPDIGYDVDEAKLEVLDATVELGDSKNVVDFEESAQDLIGSDVDLDDNINAENIPLISNSGITLDPNSLDAEKKSSDIS